MIMLFKLISGTAVIMGHDIKKNPLAVKEIIDVSPQETAIASHLNTWENLLLIGGIYGLRKEETKRQAKELIELMGLTERARDQVRKFSGGMQIRLSIAMALISDPQVLFLDEPTVGLDPQARRSMWKKIETLKGKELIFDEIIDCVRSKGTKIEWLSMKEPSLDDVFLRLTGEEVSK